MKTWGEMSNKFMSRKFWLVCSTQLAIILLLCFGKIDANVFENLTMVILTTYVAGNIVQKYTEKEKT